MKNTRFQACLAARGGSHAPYLPRQNGRIVARAPLSDLQYAYLLGELGDHPLGGPALYYSEYACERLDVIALSRALYQLMARHEMLRATFDASGTLRVHSSLPVPLSYLSLRGQPDEVCRRRLANSRDECYRQGTPLVGGAPFAVRVFALDHETIVQVVVRMLAVDGFSTEIFGQDLRAILAGEQLPSLNYTFREYRTDAERRKELPDFTADRAYWLSRLDSLPAAPRLPQRRLARGPDPQLNRRVFTLPADLWAAFANAVVKHRMTPTTAVGAAFSEVLRRWAGHPHFTINIVYSGRPAAPSDVSQVIGCFDNAVLLECAPGQRDRAFVDCARTWSRQLSRDLRHSAFSGASVVRELNQRTGGAGDAVTPVVFASQLGTGDGGAGAFLEHLGWERLDGALRIPRVSLSHEAHLADNQLVVQWDTADDIFPAGMIDDMFAGYRSLLTRLAASDGAWHGESFGPGPAAARARAADGVGTVVERPPDRPAPATGTRARPSATAPVGASGVAPTRAGPCASLVRLGDTHHGDPLVLVHPLGAGLRCYRHLVSAVESRRAVYGVLASGSPTGASVEEMAARYLTEVLAVTEERPVRLAGWSLGGLVAYEMGRRLLGERRRCTVVMIDPWLRRHGGAPPCDATLVTSFLYDLAGSELDPSGLCPAATEPALEALHRIWRGAGDDLAVLKALTFDEVSTMYRVFARNTDALLRYAVTAEPDLPVRVVEAAGGLGGPAEAYLCPLRETLPGFAATLRLPGNHFTLLDLDTAPRVAALL